MTLKKIIDSHTVPLQKEKIRLQDYAVGIFKTQPTKSGLKKSIKKGLVLLNANVAKTGDFLFGGEILELLQEENISKPTIQIPIEILFEDAHLALINKPAGITVSGNKKWTLENALPDHLSKSTEKDALQRPEPIHRLDHPTSGVLLIGKTSSAVIALNQLFETKNIEKTYFAVSMGEQTKNGILEFPIDEKPSKTTFKVCETLVSEKFDFLNLVELHPATGRKHQIRKHLAAIGNPILGDKIYGKPNKILIGNGLYLHAYSLKFTHPITSKEIFICAKLPKKFTRLFPKFGE